MITLKRKFKLIITGGLTGLVNGLFGTGGGTVLVPLLRDYIKMDEKKAFASSVAVILPVCISALIVYIAVNGYELSDGTFFCIGGVAGGFIAVGLFKKITPSLLCKAFGILLIIGGIRTVFF